NHIANQYKGPIGRNPLILNDNITVLPGDGRTGSSGTVPSHYADGKYVYTNGISNRNFESTVENIQTAIIPHESWSHNRNNWGNNNGQHHKAYLNEIDFPRFPATTDLFKATTVNSLKSYLFKEGVNFNSLDQFYQETYFKYKNPPSETIVLNPIIIQGK
ncbi:MAG: hypothetical protein Q4F57_00850, partial [Weeksellaceae bacterium]|nr:hypothetical protein [Weeksellaceae bacterium]